MAQVVPITFSWWIPALDTNTACYRGQFDAAAAAATAAGASLIIHVDLDVPSKIIYKPDWTRIIWTRERTRSRVTEFRFLLEDIFRTLIFICPIVNKTLQTCFSLRYCSEIYSFHIRKQSTCKMSKVCWKLNQNVNVFRRIHMCCIKPHNVNLGNCYVVILCHLSVLEFSRYYGFRQLIKGAIRTHHLRSSTKTVACPSARPQSIHN